MGDDEALLTYSPRILLCMRPLLGNNVRCVKITCFLELQGHICEDCTFRGINRWRRMLLGGRCKERGIVSKAFIKMFCQISLFPSTLSMKPLAPTMDSSRAEIQWHSSLRQHLKPPTKSGVTLAPTSSAGL